MAGYMYIHLMFVLVIFATAEREPEMTQKRTLDVQQLGAGTQFSVSRLVQLLDKDLVSMGHSRNGSGSTFQSNKRIDRKSTRLNSSHSGESRMPSSA